MNQLLIVCSLICIILYTYMIMGTSSQCVNPARKYRQSNSFFSQPSYRDQQYDILENNW